MSRLVERLLVSVPITTNHTLALDRFDLPAPVVSYFQHVLGKETRPIRVARLIETGTLRTDINQDRWIPFTATQVIVPQAGFVWDARVRIAPAVSIRVCDSFVDGAGASRVSLFSVPIAGDADRPEVNSASLLRYLAEAVWYPTALLPADSLEWTALSDRKALATLTTAGLTVSLEFWFSDTHEVAAIFAPKRWRKSGRDYVQTAWEGHFTDYTERGGMLVPAAAEVGWHISGEWRKVWTGRIVDAIYET